MSKIKTNLPAVNPTVERIPHAPKLRTRFWQPPRTVNSSIARVKTHLNHWKKVTEETAILVR